MSSLDDPFAAPAFSLACFVAVVLVLAIYHDKSLSRWNFVFDLSLNPLIAFLSTLSRTALLVPVASCTSQLKWIHLALSAHLESGLDFRRRQPWPLGFVGAHLETALSDKACYLGVDHHDPESRDGAFCTTASLVPFKTAV
jgi:hypothetical protein